MKNLLKGNIIIYIALLVLSILVMVMIKKCVTLSPSQRDFNEITNDTLRFVTQFYMHNDLEGVALAHYELAELIGEESGLIYKIDTINSLAESIALLNMNNYDVIARPIFATTENKKSLLFTNPISDQNRLVVVQRNEGEIKRNFDLAGKEVHIIDDEGIELIIGNMAYEIGDSIHIIKEHNCSTEQIIVMVADSTFDYAICGLIAAKRMKKYIDNINIDTEISVPLPQAWGVRQNSPTLKDSLDVWIERVKKSGKYKTLMNKYGF